MAEAVPAGFTVTRTGPDSFEIAHRRRGMGCMNLFLLAWLAFWTVGCVMITVQYAKGGTMESGEPMPAWFPAVFWLAELLVGSLLLYLLFSQITYRADPEALVVETRLLGLSRRRRFERATIRRFVQVKDGGEDEDSFPSWGLRVEADRPRTILYRQPYEASGWLGRILALWAEVEFAPALPPPNLRQVPETPSDA